MANLELTVYESQPQLVAVEKATKKPKKEADDLRRDEWSNDAIYLLLDVYEAKWNHRNRGNLKGGDWEDVALQVTARNGSSKSGKSPFQCKNKIASMKQKYRSEVLLKGINGSGCSRWPFFGRMDVMLRVPSSKEEEGMPADEMNGGGDQMAVLGPRYQDVAAQVESADSEQQDTRERGPFQAAFLQRNLESRREVVAQNRDSNQEDASNTLPPNGKTSEVQKGDSSTPRSKAAHAPGMCGKPINKHRKNLGREVVASIRSFADSILKLEEAKLEMFKDSERLRVELEARRVDMELKRTEIIMNTQLQIARLLSGNSRKKKVVTRKPAATPATASTNVASPLQTSIQALPVTAIHTSAMQATFPANVAQPLNTGITMANAAQPLQCAVQSKPS